MNRINWLQFIILPVAIALIVVAWFEPWVQWVVLSTGIARSTVVPPPLLMVLTILISTFTTRYAVRQGGRQRFIIVGSGLLAIVVITGLTYRINNPRAFLLDLLDWQFSIAPELVVMMSVAILWWRGILVGRSRALIDENIERTFYNGILALALLLFFNHFTRHITPADMLTAVLIFFATALCALTVVNIERTRLQQPEAGSWLKRQRHWLATIFGVVTTILLGGLAVTGTFSPSTLQQFLSLIGPAISSVVDVLLTLLRPVFTFLFWLISPFVPLLQILLRGLMEGIMTFLRVLHELGVQIDTLRSQQQVQTFLDSPGFVAISRGTLVILMLILFAVLAIWALRRSGLLSHRDPNETRENIATRDLLLKQLRNLLARWHARSTAPTAPYLTLRGDDPRTAVRRTYQQFLEWARLRVGERAPHQTPASYAEFLANRLPAQREAIVTLTSLYVQARYAVEDLSPAEARTAQESLTSLQSAPVIQS